MTKQELIAGTGAALLTFMSTTSGLAETTLKAFVMEMPAKPAREAAALYEQKTGLKIEFVGGPPGSWKDKVKAGEGDLVLLGAEYLMDDFQKEGLILPETRTSLGSRVAAILVPKGNPKRIASVKDLAAPGVRIMIMPVGAQVGLWEDVAAKAGLVAEIRKNIVERAPNGIKSVEFWKEGAGTKYDAWLTWSAFHAVTPDNTEIVELPRDLQVMRSVTIAVAKASRNRDAAEKFINFLTGPEGRDIHEKHHFVTR